MEEALGNAVVTVVALVTVTLEDGLVLVITGPVEGVTVEDLLRDDVVLKEGLEVLEAEFAEEEGIDPGTELLESKVGGSEESSSWVVGLVVLLEETGLTEAELESGEFAGQ